MRLTSILDSEHLFLEEKWNGVTSRSNEITQSPKELQHNVYSEMQTGGKREVGQ